MTDIERPRPAGLALPPPMPSFRLPTYHPHDPSTRNLPPIYAAAPNILPPVPARLPQPSPYYSTPQASPVSSSTGGIERWSAAPLSRLLSSPPRYTPPRSESSLSPGYALSVPSRAEGGARGFEGPPLSKRPRLDILTYPSPTYRAAPAASQSPHPSSSRQGSLSSSTDSPATLKAPPLVPSAIVAREPPPGVRPGRFEIKVRQQPLAARACGFGERDRRVIDPPPIVQLIVKEPRSGRVDADELRYPFNVVHCTLWNEANSVDETALHGQDRKVTRRLMGTLVSSPFVGQDEHDDQGCFFCFPDLSCRTNGRYRLRFVLMRIAIDKLEPGGRAPIITETTSDVFTVFTAKDFPGMRASTALTKALKRQGCAISVKKGNEKVSVVSKVEGSGEGEEVADTADRVKSGVGSDGDVDSGSEGAKAEAESSDNKKKRKR